jgi:ATP-dependent helicase/nuclease subunit A
MPRNGASSTLTEEFFAGQGPSEDKARTLFVVGDYKQAIFGFQGTSPENFEEARPRQTPDGRAADNAGVGGPDAHRLNELGLERSFRTAPCWISWTGRWRMSAMRPLACRRPEPHGDAAARLVTLWRPIGMAVDEEVEEETEEGGETGCPGPSARWPSGSRSRSSIG